jgi:hypothetical protein
MTPRKFSPLLTVGLIVLAGAVRAQTLNVSNSPGVPSVSPRIATDTQGNVHAVWVEQTRYDAATNRTYGDVYYAKGTLATLQIGAKVKLSSSNTVSCESAEMSSIAVDGSDRVYVVWTEGRQISMRTNTAGVWDAAMAVESGSVYDAPRVAATPEGNLYLAYWNNEGHVFSKARVGGVWEGAQAIGNWGLRSKMADIAVGSSMVGVCYTERTADASRYQIAYAQRSKTLNASWSGATLVAPMGLSQQHPALRLDSSDVPHIVWTTLSASEATRIVHYVRKSGAGFTSPTAISDDEMLHYPFVSIRDDEFYVVWQVGGYGNGSSVDYNIRGADGVWKGPATVPGSNGCTYVDIAATPNRDIVFFVWDTLFGTTAGEIYGWAKSFAPPNPSITLSRNKLAYGAVAGGGTTPAQLVSVVNSGDAPKSWTAATLQNWITIQPGSGAGSGRIQVAVNPVGLSVGDHAGTISVTDPDAPQYLPKTISVSLTIFAAGASSIPFGSFDSPKDLSTVRSSVPVTGWALDDVGVRAVKLYRDPVGSEPAGARIYIGDAVFVEGARPDVVLAFPSHPQNQRAGWGYMLLTNFLPGKGNGTVILRAVAEDIEGRTVDIGSKTIVVSNADAVNPFGAIDTPTQGGTASGTAFVNFGWALTPLPSSLPVDGSTIDVWVDGVPLGHPTYNQFRQDIADYFPGYSNSGGAVGYFTLNTTLWSNGVHTLAWSVRDNAGHAEGIGSRYFDVYNAGSGTAFGGGGVPSLAAAPEKPTVVPADLTGYAANVRLPIYFRKGWKLGSPLETAASKRGDSVMIEIRETERVEIHLDPNALARDVSRSDARNAGRPVIPDARLRTEGLAGYLIVGGELRALPLGSTMDPESGVFSWFPGPGFLGDYRLVFVDPVHRLKNFVTVRIIPKY